MNNEIRVLEPEDAPALAKLHDVWTHADFEQLLALPATIGWGIPGTGFILCQQVMDEAEILMIVVRKANQNQGIGQQILTYALEALAFQGVTRVFLEVNHENASAIHLYRKNGFVENGRRPGYYASPTGERHDALMMVLAVL